MSALTVDEEEFSKILTTDTTNYIVSLEEKISLIRIDFDGENLPTIGENDITCDIHYTFARETNTPQRQSVTLDLDRSVDALNISFNFAGKNYVCHIYRGATIEGIANGPNTPVQPPITEAWTGDTTPRTYRLQQKVDETVLNVNWDIPQEIASSNVIIQTEDEYYAVTINPVANPPAGNYVIKYCGQTLLNVNVNAGELVVSSEQENSETFTIESGYHQYNLEQPWTGGIQKFKISFVGGNLPQINSLGASTFFDKEVLHDTPTHREIEITFRTVQEESATVYFSLGNVAYTVEVVK